MSDDAGTASLQSDLRILLTTLLASATIPIADPPLAASRTLALPLALITPDSPRIADFLTPPLCVPNLLAQKVIDSARQSRPIYAYFLLHCAGRAHQLLPAPPSWSQLLTAQLQFFTSSPANSSPVSILWRYLLLKPRKTAFSTPTLPTLPPRLLAALWSSVFSQQSPAGNVHPLTPDTHLDGFVYDEFLALHAAAIIAVEENDPMKIAQVHALARYHMENTQPDNTTHHPWALAAFALFPDTRSFARQQLHDTRTLIAMRLSPPPATLLALLADALLTLAP